MATLSENGGFPVSAGILFGLGLGGFFDGIVLHQILQWHHMLTSAGYPPDSVENLKINTFWDGLFHASTYIFTGLGLYILWRYSRKNHIRWSGKLLPGTFLMGFGIFNLVEGIIDHHLLGIHHVNETVPREQWIFWDVGFRQSALSGVLVHAPAAGQNWPVLGVITIPPPSAGLTHCLFCPATPS